MHFDFFLPTQIIFGRDRLQELSELPMPGRKALIVITNGRSMRNLGYLDRVIGLLAAQGVDAEIFDKVLPNPIENTLWKRRNSPETPIATSLSAWVAAAPSIPPRPLR